MENGKIRIAKYLAMCGLGSRRKSEEYVAQGRVEINREKVMSPTEKVDPKIDTVKVDGRTVKPKHFVYYAVNKPAGYTTSTQDAHADQLVTELVPGDPPVWPAGRLDKDTTGLLIMTNDGGFTQCLTHPSFMKEKEYLITTDKPLSASDLDRIRKGIVLDDGPVKPDLFKRIDENRYRIVIHEGRKRIVRRLIAHFKRQVKELIRIRIGELELDALKTGEYRKLTDREIQSLY
jgi:pseudouridine synthase